MPSLTKMFLYNGMKKCIDLFTYIVLCRFPSHHIKEHVEQFLYEELEGIKIPTPKTHPIIHALNKTQRKLHRKLKNHESMYAIDTPSGPQWTLRRIAHIFGYTSYDLLMYVHYSIVQGILEKYLEVQDKDEICIHDLCIQNSAVQEMLNLYCNNGLLRNQIVIDLYQGNCYKDTYQAMADELTIRSQQMDLGRKNSVIEKLEEDNALLSIENEEHKNEIGTLKETNELLENIFNECDESIAASEDKIRELKKEKANLENRLNLIGEDKALVHFLHSGKLPEAPAAGADSLFGDPVIPVVPVSKRMNLKDKGQREACGCIVSKDIGMYDTCMHFCAYCYANASRKTVLENRRRHDPESPFLAGEPGKTNEDAKAENTENGGGR